jgi:anti-anti-sigma factor
MGRFEARTSAEPDRLVVSLAGECDLAVRDELTSALLAAVGSAETVVVDLSELAFLDSSGLHGLIMAYHAAERSRRRLYVVNPAGPVAALLAVTGIADLLSPPAGDGGHHA